MPQSYEDFSTTLCFGFLSIHNMEGSLKSQVDSLRTFVSPSLLESSDEAFLPLESLYILRTIEYEIKIIQSFFSPTYTAER